ncbi:acetylornithine deacetylase [Nitratireductor basaltis]|uniref:Acetylornithine deacetylase ArgE n=1 Tax=Nitratireductor basaltis TaxID=472175 RepID=A0A084UA46_9HYPH|nr:acetylornithine deacetylase [Nitratireductor basaltis]KFB09832.1 Acetylornithine deacetylase ArgE [Nitratireductor basaltis]
MDHLARAKGILGELIAFPTVSADSNLQLIAYASELLSHVGARISVMRDETGTKANLFATLGPEGDGGVVLSGHSDVVPVDGQNWTSDPFAMREEGGLLYGRGTCDMKGFIACCLAMAPEFAAMELKRPLHFAFTYDEEVGCMGARSLVEELKRMELRPSAAIIGEPTSMRIIEGHKGCFEYTTEFTGLAGHASRPELGVNAIEYAMRYINRLMALSEELKERAPSNRFSPPWTTLQVGRVEGGAARNVIASHARVEWEMRPVVDADASFVKENITSYVDEVLRPAMQAIHAEADIVTHVIGEVEGLEPVEESEARRIVSELTGLTEAEVVAFGTEAGLFQTAGMSAVICGPGSIDQAHKPDEFISLAQMDACLGMLERLGARLS